MPDREHDIELDQGALYGDAQIVGRYGEDHRDAFSALRFDHGPPVRILVYIAGERVDAHAETLRSLVAHLDRLVVIPTEWSLSQLAHIRGEIRDMAQADDSIRVTGSSVGMGVVNIGLRADMEPFAALLHQRYGTAVSLTLGSFRYPDGRPLTWDEELREGRPAHRAPVDEVQIPNHDVWLMLDESTVKGGANGHGHVVLTNTGPELIAIDSGRPIVAVVADSSTGETVGGYVGAIAGTGWGVRLKPGETGSITVVFGTTSFRRELGYVLPPGRYEVQVAVPVHGPPGSPPTSRAQIPVPPVPVTVL